MRVSEALSDIIRSDLRRVNEAVQARWILWAAPDGTDEISTIGVCTPTISQMDWARDLGRRLNREAAHGGQWMMVWTDCGQVALAPPGLPSRLVMVWMDGDGDRPFTVDCEDPVGDLWRATVDHLVVQCEQAHAEYSEQLKAIEIAPGQLIKQRQGQPVADTRVVQGAW